MTTAAARADAATTDLPGLSGTPALIQGAGQLVGDAVARRLAAAGAAVALCHLEEDRAAAEALAAEIGAASCAACDPADPDAVRAAVRTAVAALGGLEVLVNATVLRRDRPTAELEPADWRRVVDVELGGTAYFCREAVRSMMRRRRGRIVNLTDVSGLRGEAGAAAHSAARGGVAAMTRALAAELAPQGILVNAVAVAWLAEELDELPEPARERLLRNTPLGRAAGVDEVAEAFAYLCSTAATATAGHALAVHGGLYL